MVYLADLDSKLVYQVHSIKGFNTLTESLLGKRIVVASPYYAERLLNKGFIVLDETTDLVPDPSEPELDETGATYNIFNDYIFEEYAHRYSDLDQFLEGLFNIRNIKLEYGFSSKLGTPYYRFLSREQFNDVYDVISGLEVI